MHCAAALIVPVLLAAALIHAFLADGTPVGAHVPAAVSAGAGDNAPDGVGSLASRTDMAPPVSRFERDLCISAVLKYPVVKYGSEGDDVEFLQRKLNQKNGNNDLKVDGVFGWITYHAVINYQKSAGLAQDGDVGQNTWLSLLCGWW